MSRSGVVVSTVVTCLALAAAATPVRAQDTTKALAPAPAVDSAQMYVGDWDWTAGNGERAVDGIWRINYANGRFTGIVARPGVPVAPIGSFTLRNGREFTMTVDFNGEAWTFSGRLDNVRNISGTLSRRGGMDRVRAQKRSG
jgi:hypothetical protein